MIWVVSSWAMALSGDSGSPVPGGGVVPESRVSQVALSHGGFTSTQPKPVAAMAKENSTVALAFRSLLRPVAVLARGNNTHKITKLADLWERVL
jgi:hypothetical protein